MTSTALESLLAELTRPDQASAEAVAERASQVLRPSGALHRLDDVATWLARWQRTPTPSVQRPHAVVFAADHGVTSEGVSAYPSDVTVAMVDALRRGGATAAVMARQLQVELHVVDVGVGRPTGNLRVEPALGPERFDAAVLAGADAVRNLDADLLVFGEMGIGNTTAAAALSAAVFGGNSDEWVGPGTGVAGPELEHKRLVVRDACQRVGTDAGLVDPLTAMMEVGGSELAAMVGAVLMARQRSIPVILDGYIATAAVAPLHAMVPGVLEHCVAGHQSAEPGHGRLLGIIGLRPLLTLDLRLGEGSGALAALPLVRLAAATVVDVATFQEWGLA